jgi:hypothetical protein
MPRATLGASRRLKFKLGVAAVAAGLPLVAFVAMAPAESSSSFSGVASADGLRITTSAPGFLVVEDFVDAGGPTAQAAVSDVEGNRGFASVPYPGDLAIAGPGLFAIATGQQFPGHYPFYVASAHPTTPKNEYAVPGLSMTTESDATSSSSHARFGPADDGPGGARSSAKVVHGPEGMTSEATGSADLVKVGPVSVAGFRSVAKVTRTSGGEPQRSSSMEFRALKVGDTPVGVRDGQFVVAGTTVPLSGFAPVQKALADAGVTLEVVQATRTDDGVVSPGIQITRTQPADAAGTRLIVRYTLGRALAAAKAEAGSGSPGLDLGGTTPPGLGSPTTPAAPAPSPAPGVTAPVAAASPAVSDSTVAPSLGSSAGPGASSSSAGSTGSSGSLSSPAASEPQPAGEVAAPGPVDASLASAPMAAGPIAPLSSWSFFPMMLLAGIAVAVVALGRKILVRS